VGVFAAAAVEAIANPAAKTRPTPLNRQMFDG
jgi:hypothetical protein